MPRFPGFIGPSYTAISPQADNQLTRNLLPSVVESGYGKSKVFYFGRPGLSVFATFPDSPLRALFYQDGRAFGISGAVFGEIVLSGPLVGTVINQNAVANDGLFAYIASDGFGSSQLFIVSGGKGYVFNLNTNVMTPITDVNFPPNAQQGLFTDGFFIALQANTDTMFLSALDNPLLWTPVNSAQRSTTSDIIQTIALNHRELWLFGSLTTEVWYDTGASTGFPYAPIPGAAIEQGAFRYSVSSLDNTLFWVGQDRNGPAMGYRADGYFPKRVSTAAVEYAWSQYLTVNDVESFAYQEAGHTYWVVNFPNANATWVYDVQSDMWTEQDWYNATLFRYERALPRVHCACFGSFGQTNALHLVGDRQTGNVYVQSLGLYDDAGGYIHRRRRAPHMFNDNKWVKYDRFELFADMGLGVPSDLQHDPQVTLRWSNDGGRTWSNDYTTSLGKQGNYQLRAIWRRLGRARDRVFEVEVVEKMPIRFIDASLDFKPGTS